MRSTLRFLAFTAALACGGSGGTDNGGNNGGGGGDDTGGNGGGNNGDNNNGGGNGGSSGPNGNDVNAEGFDGKAASTGADFTCMTPDTDWASVTWAPAQDVDMANEGTLQDVTGRIEDFETGDPATSMLVSLWFDDVVDRDNEDTRVQGGTAAEASFTDVPACQPLSYLVEEQPGLNVARPTFKAHQIYGYAGGSTFDKAIYTSVSNNTFNLIPTIFGIDIDASKGTVAGTIFDCSRDPDTDTDIDDGKVNGAQVRIFGCPNANSAPADCTADVPGVTMRYFIDSFPSRDQAFSSPDGLFGAFNVPPGTYRLDAYVNNGGSLDVIGSTVVSLEANSINIGNIFAGYNDGVKYPDTCLVP